MEKDFSMKTEKLKIVSLREMAEEWGINYEVCKIKSELIECIKNYCKREKISQRALAKKVPGLSQDRISKIFNDQIGHMTIDKLIQTLSALGIKVSVKPKKLSSKATIKLFSDKKTTTKRKPFLPASKNTSVVSSLRQNTLLQSGAGKFQSVATRKSSTRRFANKKRRLKS